MTQELSGSSLFRVGEHLYVSQEAVELLHLVQPHREPDHAPANREPEPAPVPGPSAPPDRRMVASISGGDDLALAPRGRHQALDPPQLDLPSRPYFEPKAGRVLDLYARQFEGRPLKPDEFVISADEKDLDPGSDPLLSERCRQRAASHAGRARVRPGRGSLAYITAWDVHRAKLFGRLESTTGIAPFGQLVSEVMAEKPYPSARCVFWVLDNGSSHRGDASVRRLQEVHANLMPVHLPLHASWLNQVGDLLLDPPAHGPHSGRCRIARRPCHQHPRLPGQL